MLERPEPGNWIHWRRTLDAWAYSPMTQIHTGNARQLQLAWNGALRPGVSEPAPLVHDGVMFIPQAAAVVRALDTATGDLLWEYVRKFERSPDICLPSQLRSLALHGHNLFVATPDAHLVALDTRTGKVIRDCEVADDRLGCHYTSGPIVVKGKVVAGMTGCERYKDDVCDAYVGNAIYVFALPAK
jgi:alcohol dehydrogenase (cytochrome c)